MMLELNKIYNMDCIEGMKQIDDNSIDLIIADPPYNIGIDEWDKVEDYENFTVNWLSEVVRILKPNKALWVFCNQHNVTTLNYILSRMSLFKFRSWIVWNKGNGIPNSNNFTNCHEQILYYIKQPDSKVLSEFGSYIKKRRNELGLSLKDVSELCNEKWYYRGGHLYFETGLSKPNVEQYLKLKEVLKLDDRFDIWLDNNFVFNLESVGVKWKYEKDKRNKRGWKNCGDIWNINTQPFTSYNVEFEHFAVFPEVLIEKPIKASCPKDGVVLDCFCGRGTVGKVAKQLGLNYVLFDIKPEYCKLAQLYINGQKRKIIEHQQKLQLGVGS